MNIFDLLTKSGLLKPNGDVQYYPSQDATMNAASDALAKASPQVTNLNAPPANVQVGPPDSTVPPAPQRFDAVDAARALDQPDVPYPAPTSGPPEVGPPTLGYNQTAPTIDTSAEKALPIEGKPSFQSLTTDNAGNQKPIGPGLTKLGLLASLLKAGMTGMTDSIASGSLDAVQGRSGFGSGFAGAVNLPIVRAQRAADLAREAAATKAAQAQTAHTTAETAQLPMQANYLQAHANYMNATASKKDQRTPEDVYMEKFQAAQSKGLNPVTDTETVQALAAWQEYEKGKALAHPAASPKALTPHTVTTAKGVYQLNPDTGRYDIYVGPPVQEIKYDHSGDGSDPVMDRRLAQVEKTSTDALVSHGKNIASRISKLDPQDPNYANQMAAIERDDYQNKAMLAKGYAKQRSALGYQTDVPQFDPWTDSYLSDDERTKLLGGGDQPAKSSGLLPWLKKGSSSTTKHLPGNPYAK